jgi:hypothetical protein
MRRRLLIGVLSGIFIVTCFNFISYALAKKNLYDALSCRKAVKVFVADVEDSTQEKAADIASLKDLMENALSARMTINFDVVQKKEDADILILCDIEEYIWKDKGFFDMIPAARFVAGTLIRGNFARMQAEFTVSDAVTSKVMWKEKLKASISDKAMSRSDSVLMVNEKIVKIFVREAFSRTDDDK